MDVPPHPDPDERTSAAEPIRTSGDDIQVRKVASMFTEEAVAVDLTIRSDRSDRCVVEVTDALPGAVQDNLVEFHPHYDPDHWTREPDRVVYRAPIGPEVVRRTMYGVTVDDPAQLALFTGEPTVEADGLPEEHSEIGWGEPTGAGEAAGIGFDRDDGQASPDGDDGGSDGGVPESPATYGDERPESSGAVEPAGDAVVTALVDELRRRELTEAEQTALRSALDLGTDRAAREELASTIDALEADLAALREQVTTADGPAGGLATVEERLDALAEELETVSTSLSADLEAVRTALDREVRWRSRLRQSLSEGPGER